MASDSTKPPSTISLRAPSAYLTDKSQPSTTDGAAFVSPPLEWLYRTWSVTHSTLPMWRSARNVRITYKPLPTATSEVHIDDLVEYEKANKSGAYKTVAGIDKPDPTVPASWNWRGKGWLKIASSHWEVLGWGERPLSSSSSAATGREQQPAATVERWVVTWFAATLFTPEGVDIYTDRPEGISPETLAGVTAALNSLQSAPKVVQYVEKDLREIQIQLPWKQGKS
ncbi:hypothetical protein PG993_007764 [Apiospora rasikravindrae]|uniref:Uncharacterized protein n=1 Tax=Apiospora rasikravindrae TaxID=990691 RepID=A0ABR1SYF4_9PEZI